MTAKLNTITVQTQAGWSNGSAAPSGSLLIPLPNMTFVKPLSYEFRVVEYMKEDKVEKVALQVQVWEHDNNGDGFVVQDWTTIERVQIPL